MNDLSFSEYIVPIYLGNEFSGNGFIIGNYLITASHVVNNSSNAYFYFKQKQYDILKDDLVYSKYCENDDCQLYDLSIYRFHQEESNLIMSSDYVIRGKCEYWGFNFDSKNDSLTPLTKTDIDLFKDYAFSYSKPTPRRLNNCFTASCSCLESGNSGGPVFQNGSIIGMLVRCNEMPNLFRESIILKSEFIMINMK